MGEQLEIPSGISFWTTEEIGIEAEDAMIIWSSSHLYLPSEKIFFVTCVVQVGGY